jgi:hypothetical protein
MFSNLKYFSPLCDPQSNIKGKWSDKSLGKRLCDTSG